MTAQKQTLRPQHAYWERARSALTSSLGSAEVVAERAIAQFRNWGGQRSVGDTKPWPSEAEIALADAGIQLLDLPICDGLTIGELTRLAADDKGLPSAHADHEACREIYDRLQAHRPDPAYVETKREEFQSRLAALQALREEPEATSN